MLLGHFGMSLYVPTKIKKKSEISVNNFILTTKIIELFYAE